MRLRILILIIYSVGLNFFVPKVFSQNIPSFTTSIYDSTLTGYFFFTSMDFANSQPGHPPAQFIIDTKGDLIYYNRFTANPLTTDFKIQPDGRISYFRQSQYYLLDSTFSIVDSVGCIGYDTDPHDLQILSNGNFLLLGTETIIMDLSSYHYFNHNGTSGSDSAQVTSGLIQMLDSNKNVVFEWHANTHFQFDDVYQYWLFDPFEVDWTHCNSIEMDYDGNLLLSSRHFNEVTKIDANTGDIIWRMGGKNNQFIFYNDSFPFFGQHDVRRIANGNLTLFDNGKFINSHAARGIEYFLDETIKTATLYWSYTYDSAVYSLATGNTQRVDIDKTLINWGFRTNSTVCFTLVDTNNNKLFELNFPDSLASYRAFYYPTLQWQFNRPELTCFQQGGNYFLQTTSTFNSYQWTNGETTASIQITAPGTYSVFVPYGEGFIHSEIFDVININTPCILVSDAEDINSNFNFSLFPNPSESFIVCTPHLPDNIIADLSIYDQFGRFINVVKFESGLHEVYINVDHLNPGVYYLLMKDGKEKKMRKKFLIMR